MSQFPRSILFPAIACLLFLLSACATTPETGARVTPLPVTPQAVSIFYATNRASDPEPGEYFGPERGNLSFGIAHVGIPLDHEIGRYESPSVFRFEWDPDERKHIVLQDIEALDQGIFLMRLQEAIDASLSRKILLFVHGYNVDFALASERLAQFATDLKFDGPVVLFAWPSQGTLTGYTKDETNVEWAQVALTQVMTMLLDHIPSEQIVLAAHSMGARAITRAYKNVTNELPEDIHAVMNEMILVAPDVDADLFRQESAPALARSGMHVTLYASSADRALLLSKGFHGYPRAGDSGEGLVLVPGVETIDASESAGGLLGHSYFAEDRRIMEDIYAILQTGMRADQRFGLRPVDTTTGRYWTFRK